MPTGFAGLAREQGSPSDDVPSVEVAAVNNSARFGARLARW
jgi:hypothetical protein